MGLERIVQSMLFRGAVKRLDNDSDVQGVQTSGLGGYIDEAEHIQPYGFRSRAFAGAQTVVGRLGAVGALVAWIFDGRYRIALEEGEVAIFDDQGQKVHLKRGGIEIVDKSAQSIITGATGIEVTAAAGKKITLKRNTDVSGKCNATTGFAFNGADGKTGVLTITIAGPGATAGVATLAIAGGIITNVATTDSCVWVEV